MIESANVPIAMRKLSQLCALQDFYFSVSGTTVRCDGSEHKIKPAAAGIPEWVFRIPKPHILNP